MRIRIQFFVDDADPGREKKRARGDRTEGGRKSDSGDSYPYPNPNPKRARLGAKDFLDRSRGLGNRAGE